MTKVLVSPGYGAGWATWNTEHNKQKQLAEDPQLIAMVEAGTHVYPSKPREFGRPCVSDAFIARAREVNGGEVYCGGVSDLVVVEVEGPYLIEEYDGHEWLYTSADFW